MSQTPDRLRGYLTDYAQSYPNAWKLFEHFRAGRGKDLPSWPDWCWCPLAASYAIVSGGGRNRVPLDRVRDVGILGTLAAWRMTQGIYRFDTDMFTALWTTPLDGELPVDVLYHMPEWCVYIEAPPGHEYYGQSLHGWFVHLEWDAETKRPELRFVFDLNQGLLPAMIHLTAPTLEECVLRAMEEGARQAQKYAVDMAVPPEAIAMHKSSLAPVVSVVLYLCTMAADIADLRGKRERPGNPMPRKTKRGVRVFPGPATTWLVGYRIGASLRLAGGGGSGGAGTGTHASPRAHVRRAHWHSYWIGPRNDPGKRKIALKWLPPIPVGAGEIVPTIHGVD